MSLCVILQVAEPDWWRFTFDVGRRKIKKCKFVCYSAFFLSFVFSWIRHSESSWSSGLFLINIDTTMRLIVLFICLTVGIVTAIPRPNKTRVKDEVILLNISTPPNCFFLTIFKWKKQPLSHHKHFENEEHNADYDHEAFLGEEAKTFDQLTPEESKERLG